MSSWIDGALYPDTEPSETLETLAGQVHFLVRLCGARDFGVLPYPETVAEIRRPEWREAVDACRLLTSLAYHLLRTWHNLEPLTYLGARLAYIWEDPNLKYI
jgi:hypothetical protein